MEEDKELYIYIDSEAIAFFIAGALSKKGDRYIDQSLVYSIVKDYSHHKEYIDEIFRATMSLLEDKYGLLFDVDKEVNI